MQVVTAGRLCTENTLRLCLGRLLLLCVVSFVRKNTSFLKLVVAVWNHACLRFRLENGFIRTQNVEWIWCNNQLAICDERNAWMKFFCQECSTAEEDQPNENETLIQFGWCNLAIHQSAAQRVHFDFDFDFDFVLMPSELPAWNEAMTVLERSSTRSLSMAEMWRWRCVLVGIELKRHWKSSLVNYFFRFDEDALLFSERYWKDANLVVEISWLV